MDEIKTPQPPPKATVSVLLIEGLIEQASDAGFSTEDLFIAAEIEPPNASVQENWRHRIPMEQLDRLWGKLQEKSPDDSLAIRMASKTKPGNMGLLGYVMMSSKTLGEAIEQMLWAKRLLSDDLVLVERHGERVAIRYELASPGLSSARYILEHACVSLVGMCRWLTGTHLTPIELWSTFEKSMTHPLFEEVIGAPIHTKKTYNACFYTTEDMALPLVSANRELHTQLKRSLQQQIDILEETQPISKRLALSLLKPCSPPEPPTIEVMAKRLGSSVRTLQRRLREEGCSFRQVVQKAQLERAQRLLLEPSITIEEIAWQLGFSEASTFSRAFRRWTGRAPGHFRKMATQNKNTHTTPTPKSPQ